MTVTVNTTTTTDVQTRYLFLPGILVVCFCIRLSVHPLVQEEALNEFLLLASSN